jgi:hypothetical protein
MIPPTERFPYVEADPSLGAASALPYVPITLAYERRDILVSGLVDSGATLNVLPYDLGVQLGAVWERQNVPILLTGNLAESEARAIVLTAKVGRFEPVRLAFAWTRSNRVPLILGQVNFFMEFDAGFSRSRWFFEIRPKGTAGGLVTSSEPCEGRGE